MYLIFILLFAVIFCCWSFLPGLQSISCVRLMHICWWCCYCFRFTCTHPHIHTIRNGRRKKKRSLNALKHTILFLTSIERIFFSLFHRFTYRSRQYARSNTLRESEYYYLKAVLLFRFWVCFHSSDEHFHFISHKRISLLD